MNKIDFKNIHGDVLGGIMTAVVALPVAMAFGVASGLGAAPGLYGAMACGLLAALFGGTKGQQSGPTGPIAVVIAAMLVSTGGDFKLVFAATILAGLLQILMGKMKWGELVRYIPYPVISGFMTGIALIIIIIHINPFFGIKASKQVVENLETLPQLIPNMNLQALGIAVLTFALIYFFKAISKRLPSALLALGIASVASVLMGLDIPRIGEIPKELPVPSIPIFDVVHISTVILGAITIAVLGAVDSLLTSLIADKLLDSHHDSNKELVGQGLGNMMAGLLGGLAGAGSTTRTLANIDAGGRTPIAGIIYALIIFSVLAFLGDIAAQVPLSALAAILISLGIHIVDWRAVKHVTKAPKSDVIVMSTVLFLTVFVDLIQAVAIGTALACALLVKKITDARLSEWGTLAHFIETEPHGDEIIASLQKDTLVYSFHGPIFFGETKNLNKALAENENLRFIVLDFQHAPFIDQSCCYFLEDTIRTNRSKNVVVITLGITEPVKDALTNMDCAAVLSEEFSAKSWDAAIKMINSYDKGDSTVASSKGASSASNVSADQTSSP